jgi:hypothetical protein
MTKARRILVWSGAGIAGAVLAAIFFRSVGRADERVTGLPTTKRVTYQLPPKDSPNLPYFRLGPAVALLDGKPLAGGLTGDLEAKKTIAREVQAVWKLRRTTLPRDADRLNTDAYSKELYWVPDWIRANPDMLNGTSLVQGGNGVPVDEFGRGKPGHYGSGDNSLWGQTFGGLLKNPLFRTVAIAALVASGPTGIAVYGAYTMWENRGKELTLKNVALTAGRAYAAGQCGQPCAAAFDFGVGAASGKSLDKSAEDAMYAELTPQQQQQYRLGKQSVQKLGVT